MHSTETLGVITGCKSLTEYPLESVQFNMAATGNCIITNTNTGIIKSAFTYIELRFGVVVVESDP